MAKHRLKYDFYQFPYHEAGPALPINFVNPIDKVSFRWHSLIDTGADTCLFPGAIAELSGHDLTGDGVRRDMTMGIEGMRLRTWRHTFVIELLHPTDDDKVVWRSRRRLFDCIENDDFPPLLGQGDFLCGFAVTVDYPKKITTLEWND